MQILKKCCIFKGAKSAINMIGALFILMFVIIIVPMDKVHLTFIVSVFGIKHRLSTLE